VIDVSAASLTRREKGLAVASLAAVTGLAWAYLVVEAQRMGAMSAADAMPGMAMAPPMPWNVSSLLLTFAMWTVMMIGMMLPSAAPMLLLYGRMASKSAPAGAVSALWIFATGYFLVWAGFSFLATILQAALQSVALLSASLTSASARLSGLLLVVAGLYQWLPLKYACLDKCRAPLQFLLMRWRPGTLGGLKMGAEHGVACVGCCWALMLLLFVLGVMSLFWVALLAAFVFVEKLAPAPKVMARVAGLVLMAAGGYLAAVGSSGMTP
jgi:predicted metal-binding membrane protein